MSLNLNKIKTFIGFAIKSRNIIFGTDKILLSKKQSLVLISDELADSSRKKLKNHCEKCSIDCFSLKKDEFLDIIQNDNVKAIAILDKNLALAIKKILTNDGLGGQFE